MKSQREQDKENFDAAQKELEKEGKGARKRMRVRGVKENIGDATWKADTNEDIMDNGTTDSTNIEGIVSVSLNDADANVLQFVPRKRTNANHVITPRKPLRRQATLNGQAQTQAWAKPSHLSPEKPRRRKSMRKSIRKSATGGILDLSMAPMESTSTNDKPATEVIQVEVEVETIVESDPRINTEVEGQAAGVTLNDKLNELFDFTNHKLPRTGEHQQILGTEAGQPSGSNPSSSQVAKIPLNDLYEHSGKPSDPSQVNDIAEEDKQTVDTNKEQSSRGRQPLEIQSTILESIETGPEPAQPVKTTSTPKKKRGTSQRRGTRRSTRTTRASSVRAEEQSVPDVKNDQIASEESTSHPSKVAPDAVRELAAEPVVQTAENVLETPREQANQVTDAQVSETTETVIMPEQTSTNSEGKLEELLEETVADLENKAIESRGMAPSGELVESDEAELENFNISAQQTSQLFVLDQGHHIADEDFELPPVSASAETPFSDTLQGKAQPEVVSGPEADLRSPPGDSSEEDLSSVRFSPTGDESNPPLSSNSEELTVEVLKTLESISIPADSEGMMNGNETMRPPTEDLPARSPDPSTSKLVETISENAPPVAYDHDDTDMLWNFLTRVKANKAAKAGIHIPKRKRSLPHSPLRLPLGENANISPSPHKMNDEFDVGPLGPSPSKRQKRNDPVLVDEDDTITERKPTRRSGRTRLPVVKTLLGAPSHIPVRRLGQDGDTTVTLKRSEEKELAALTRVNTRKNKGGSQSVLEVLAKKAEEKEDPVLRQRLLKEVFNEKARKGKKDKKPKSVVWAEELTQYQTMEARKSHSEKEKEKETEKLAPVDEKKSAVKVGIRSKIALGMAVNGTPAPKKKRACS